MRRSSFEADPARLAALGAFLAVGVAALARGRVHPDEVFQFLEPAHGLAFGYRVVAWEWVQGLRNWGVPGVLAGLLALCRAVGLEHPWAMVALVWCVCAGVQAVGTLTLFRLVEVRDGREAALLAAAVHATWGGFLIYAARPLGDGLSVVPLLGALLWARRARDRGGLREGLWSGVWLGLAFVIRYPSAVFGVPLAVSLLGTRRWRSLAGFSVGVGAVLLGLGVLDWLTWGGPWHSAWSYFHFNIASGSSASQFGRQPGWWYAPIFAGMAPLLLLWHFARGLARRDVLVGAFAFYLGVVSALGHKEARFLVPLLPLFIAIAAGPAARDLSRMAERRAVLGLLGGLYVLTSVAAASVLFPVGLRQGVIDATVSAGRDATLTGLVIAGPPEWNTGGRFYLHREVPVFVAAGRPEEETREKLADTGFSHALVDGTAVEEDTLRATGFCFRRRWGAVALWTRCPSPGERQGATRSELGHRWAGVSWSRGPSLEHPGPSCLAATGCHDTAATESRGLRGPQARPVASPGDAALRARSPLEREPGLPLLTHYTLPIVAPTLEPRGGRALEGGGGQTGGVPPVGHAADGDACHAPAAHRSRPPPHRAPAAREVPECAGGCHARLGLRPHG
jgi:hypothetical protein